MVKKNRWLMALSAVGVHICIGSVYAWSVYVKTNPRADVVEFNRCYDCF